MVQSAILSKCVITFLIPALVQNISKTSYFFKLFFRFLNSLIYKYHNSYVLQA